MGKRKEGSNRQIAIAKPGDVLRMIRKFREEGARKQADYSLTHPFDRKFMLQGTKPAER